jgi:hypothetical protein
MKSDDSKDRIRAALFFIIPKYRMRILLGDLNAKEGRENVLRPTVGNETQQQDTNDNGVCRVNFTSVMYS